MKAGKFRKPHYQGFCNSCGNYGEVQCAKCMPSNWISKKSNKTESKPYTMEIQVQEIKDNLGSIMKGAEMVKDQWPGFMSVLLHCMGFNPEAIGKIKEVMDSVLYCSECNIPMQRNEEKKEWSCPKCGLVESDGTGTDNTILAEGKE